MEKDLIVDSENMYRLFQDAHGRLGLGVMCGGVAMYEVAFILSNLELEQYQVKGKEFLDALSHKVAKHPESYEDR